MQCRKVGEECKAVTRFDLVIRLS